MQLLCVLACVARLRAAIVPSASRFHVVPELADDPAVEVDFLPVKSQRAYERKLQAYHTFSCALPTRRGLKLGVLVDRPYFVKAGYSRTATIEKVKNACAVWSAPFEKQFNIQLSVDEVLFDFYSVVKDFGRGWMACDEITNSMHSTLEHFSSFRNAKRASQGAAWIFLTGCDDIPASRTVGMAWVGTLGMTDDKFGTDKTASAAVIYDGYELTAMHEIGHLMGARHTFGDPHNLPQNSGMGIMDYGQSGVEDQYFHSLHDTEMCGVINVLTSDAGWGYVSSNEMWDFSVTEPATTPAATTTVTTTTETTTVATTTETTTVATTTETTTVATSVLATTETNSNPTETGTETNSNPTETGTETNSNPTETGQETNSNPTETGTENTGGPTTSSSGSLTMFNEENRHLILPIIFVGGTFFWLCIIGIPMLIVNWYVQSSEKQAKPQTALSNVRENGGGRRPRAIRSHTVAGPEAGLLSATLQTRTAPLELNKASQPDSAALQTRTAQASQPAPASTKPRERSRKTLGCSVDEQQRSSATLDPDIDKRRSKKSSVRKSRESAKRSRRGAVE